MQNRGQQRLEVENGELVFDGYKVSAWEDEKVLEKDDGERSTTI